MPVGVQVGVLVGVTVGVLVGFGGRGPGRGPVGVGVLGPVGEFKLLHKPIASCRWSCLLYVDHVVCMVDGRRPGIHLLTVLLVV